MELKSSLRYLRRLAQAGLGRDVAYRAEVRLPAEWFGSTYGGWMVCPKRLTADSIVYSFGIGRDASFGLELIRRLGLTVHGFDPTPKAIEFVRSSDMPPSYIFHDIGIADYDGTATFEAPRNPTWDSYTLLEGEGDRDHVVTATVRRLSSIMQDLGHSQIDILKLDVEGAEYGALADLIASEIDVRQILVEFHHRFKSVGLQQTADAVELLRRSGFKTFYVSPNGEEYSFIRNDQIANP